MCESRCLWFYIGYDLKASTLKKLLDRSKQSFLYDVLVKLPQSTWGVRLGNALEFNQLQTPSNTCNDLRTNICRNIHKALESCNNVHIHSRTLRNIQENKHQQFPLRINKAERRKQQHLHQFHQHPVSRPAQSGKYNNIHANKQLHRPQPSTRVPFSSYQ